MTEKREWGEEKRRNPRVMLTFSLQIKGLDEVGNKVDEETRTINVSRLGARIVCHSPLAKNSVLEMRLKSHDEWARFRVAWIGQGENGKWQVGVEILDAKNFFGITWPEEQKG